jgi:RIO kinase 1
MNEDDVGRSHKGRSGPRGSRSTRASKNDQRREYSSRSASGRASAADLPAEFAANVQVTDSERQWIRKYLGPFHGRQLITDVVSRVKAGKEATVYICTGHPSFGQELMAAKVYHQRSQRSSKNASDYHQGRAVLDEDGNDTARGRRRGGKSASQKSPRGVAAAQTSWLMHEFTTLQTLHALGADVPQAFEHADNALLMEFIGSDHTAASTLIDGVLLPEEAPRLFERLVFNVELMLGQGWVHGDLSAHNLMYRDGGIVLIDFPQVVDCHNNPRARGIFERDIKRITQYFASSGVHVDSAELAAQLWTRYVPEPEHPLEF